MSSVGRLAVAGAIALIMLRNAISAHTYQQISLDNSRQVSIIVFTVVSDFGLGTEYAADVQGHRQTKRVTAKRHTQSSAPGCATSSVPRQRFLRPGRYDSGQVRDAPTGPCRPSVSFPGGRRVWAFPAVVLPGQRGLRAGGRVRADATETRSQKRSQTHAGSDGIRSHKANIGSVAQFPSLAGLVKTDFKVQVHPRSIERQLLREKNPLKSDLAALASPKDEAPLPATKNCGDRH